MKIPIVIGITGHRDLRESDIPKLRELVTDELHKLIERYPNSEFVLLDSIASGADTLCAEVALALGMKLVCPLPMLADEYRKDFSKPEAIRFDALLQKAADVFVVPATEPLPDTLSRDFHYRQAGVYVAAHSHVLLALWDGMPSKPDGCGTAEAVDFMLKGSYEGRGGFRVTNDGAVLHILTPRQSGETGLTISSRLLENELGSLHEMLYMTDTFNADIENMADASSQSNALLPEESLNDADEGLKKLHKLYQAADCISLRFRDRYLSAMRWFSVFGVMLVLFFLLYDELECNLFLLCYGALIILYVLAFVLVRRGKSHERYLQYRMLSETLRAQFYLKAAGLNDNLGNAFTWTQKQESTWIKKAISALLIDDPIITCIPDAIIKQAWIDGQLIYHQKAQKIDQGKQRVSERMARWMIYASIALFVLVFALEFFSKQTMTSVLFDGRYSAVLLHHAEQDFTLRSLLKILFGGVSAITVFLANYYGKLSLERKSIDHKKMVGLYSMAKEQYESGRVDRKQLFRELAHEEIIENGNWFSYCRENMPTFNV